jgi:hypothetical protein
MWVFVAYAALVSAIGSHLAVEEFLGWPKTWEEFVRLAHEHGRGDDLRRGARTESSTALPPTLSSPIGTP